MVIRQGIVRVFIKNRFKMADGYLSDQKNQFLKSYPAFKDSLELKVFSSLTLEKIQNSD